MTVSLDLKNTIYLRKDSVANCLIEPTDQYLRTFSWNKVRYRSDRPMAELIETLQKVGGPLLVNSSSESQAY